MTSEEKYLVKKIRQGDYKAFEQLYKTFYSSLVDFVLLFTDDEFCAKEVVSEFFTNLWEKHTDFSVTKNLPAYLYKSVKNRLITKLRKKQTLLRLNENLDKPDEVSPELLVIKREEQEKVKSLLDLLPPRSREIFIMHKYDRLKYREIAELLGVSVKTVENHIVKAMKILRDYYNSTRSE